MSRTRMQEEMIANHEALSKREREEKPKPFKNVVNVTVGYHKQVSDSSSSVSVENMISDRFSAFEDKFLSKLDGILNRVEKIERLN